MATKQETKKIVQSIIFPMKYWQEGSCNWCICPSGKLYWAINFLEDLEGLNYRVDGSLITIWNGEFIPIDAQGNEAEEHFEHIKLEWTV